MAVALFVLCQATSGVGARLVGDPASGAAVSQGLCLGNSPHAGGARQADPCPSLCQSQHAWSTPSAALASFASDLPAFSIPAAWTPPSVRWGVAAKPPLLEATSRPLFIVHCRLHN